jgi:hypothetical protein
VFGLDDGRIAVYASDYLKPKRLGVQSYVDGHHPVAVLNHRSAPEPSPHLPK